MLITTTSKQGKDRASTLSALPDDGGGIVSMDVPSGNGNQRQTCDAGKDSMAWRKKTQNQRTELKPGPHAVGKEAAVFADALAWPRGSEQATFGAGTTVECPACLPMETVQHWSKSVERNTRTRFEPHTRANRRSQSPQDQCKDAFGATPSKTEKSGGESPVSHLAAKRHVAARNLAGQWLSWSTQSVPTIGFALKPSNSVWM